MRLLRLDGTATPAAKAGARPMTNASELSWTCDACRELTAQKLVDIARVHYDWAPESTPLCGKTPGLRTFRLSKVTCRECMLKIARHFELKGVDLGQAT